MPAESFSKSWQSSSDHIIAAKTRLPLHVVALLSFLQNVTHLLHSPTFNSEMPEAGAEWWQAQVVPGG